MSCFNENPCAKRHTLDFLNKKHVKFDQGLDFLIFYQGNPGKHKESTKKNINNRRKTIKSETNPGSYFLLNNFLFKKRSVGVNRLFIE